MDKNETDDGVYRRTALRGALWTIPLWAAILESCFATASGRFGAFTLTWPESVGNALYVLLFLGSSLCMLFSFVLTSRPLDFTDAAKKGLSSALTVAAAYLGFGFAALFSADPKGRALGVAFGLLSASGALVAALIGAFIKLGLQSLGKTILNPYRKSPFPPRK